MAQLLEISPTSKRRGVEMTKINFIVLLEKEILYVKAY